MFMQSSGGLTGAGNFQGKDAILSGPAGGVVGAVRTSQVAGQERIIGFDMGGTSTDVCHFAGELERVLNTAIAGVRITAPMMMIHTVAAGGGSILSFDGARMRVGPESAGADPGPASYGRGGPLAVTDANVVTGRLRPEFFPAIFGPGADRPLDAGAARAGFAEMAARIGRPVEEVAEGFLRIAVENMANAIKTISVQRGYDVSGYCLTVFGGAGAQHACAIADTLGMRTCLVHPMASLLSAYGMGLADIRATRTQAMEAPLDAEGRLAAAALLDTLGSDAELEVEAQGVPPGQIRLAQVLLLKVKGTDTALPIPFAELDALKAAFQAAHRERFGFEPGDAPLIIEAAQAEAVGRAADLTEPALAEHARPEDTVEVALTAPVFLRRRLGRGAVRAAGGARSGGPADRAGGAGRAAHLDPDRAGVAGAGDGARSCGARAGRAAASGGVGGHAGRSGDARGLQQPLHVDRRADGGGAREHRRQRDDQGAAGFLLRGLRRGGRPHRQRAAHAGASRLHGGEREGGDRAEPGDGARRRLRAERPLQRGDAPAGHHRGAPRLGRRRARGALLLGGARASYRRRRADAGVDAAGQPDDRRRGRLYRQLEAGGARPLPRGGDAGAAARGEVSGALAGDQPRRPQGAGGGLREGGAGARAHGEPVRAGGGAGLHGPRAGQCRGMRAAGDRGVARRGVRLSDGPGLRRQAAGDPGQDRGRPGAAGGGDRLHRHDGGAGRRTTTRRSR